MAGQPPKFGTVEELEEGINAYFKSLEYVGDNGQEMNHPATITGLALQLGFCSRQSMYDYEKNPEYSYTIKNARLRVEHSYEQHLFTKSATGAIFGLKNFGWTDKVEVESHNVNLNGELNEDEKKEALDKIKSGLDEFKDYK